jgi:ketosteroid isomerase-like protein
VSRSTASSPADLVRDFIGRINAHDTEGLVALLSPDQVFIDSLGNRLPAAAAREGWAGYFRMVPDYWVVADETLVQGDVVVLFGRAGGTFVPEGAKAQASNRWEAPAAWRAVVSGGKLREWRVYCDNEPIREKMRAAPPARPPRG